jgi:hypothetical protein
MMTSEARNLANQANAAKSTGPRTVDAKERPHSDSLQPGWTGEGIEVPAEDAEEIEQRFQAFRTELQASGALGLTLVRRAATHAVRMEKCAERDLASISERVIQAVADVEMPEDGDVAEWKRLQIEAGRLASFDTSREACLARRYEAASERGFYRALKEFRLLQKQAKPPQPAPTLEEMRSELASFLEMSKRNAEFDSLYPEEALPKLNHRFDPAAFGPPTTSNSRVDVPITIGRRR